jgi:type II secretory pathway component GspD/PulD (secretin)
MKRKWLLTAVVAFALLQGGSMFAEKVKKIRFKQDDAQPYMVTKVYELKNMRADDLVPWVLGAVKRYDIQSTVERLNYKPRKEFFLVVTTPPEMMPYVDDMIQKFDRPGERDSDGSLIEGTGIFRYAYKPKYRSTEEMVYLLNNAVKSGDGQVYRNPDSNIIYWKDSPSDSGDLLTWVQRFDRPVPQVNITINVFEVRESTLRDIGIDYLAWKNGPGLNMFSTGLESLDFLSTDVISNPLFQKGLEAFSNVSYSFGGFFVAPQFDMSFVRCLQQSGLAKLSATASLTVINNESGTYTVKFAPQYQNINKENNDRTSVVIGANTAMGMVLKGPTICFHSPQDRIGKNGELEFSREAYEKLLSGAVIFSYNISTNNVVERNNVGDELTEFSNVNSDITLAFKTEKMLASWGLESNTTETIGIPFLSDIPYLKYLFSSETTVKDKTFFFVSANAELVHPESSLSPFARRVISATEMGKEENAIKSNLASADAQQHKQQSEKTIATSIYAGNNATNSGAAISANIPAESVFVGKCSVK